MENVTSFLWTDATGFIEGNSTSSVNSTISQEPKIAASVGIQYLSQITLPIFLVLGLVGNTLTLIVVRRQAYTSTFHGLLIAAMAVFMKAFVQKLFGLDIRGLSDVGCSIYMTLVRTSKIGSAWLVILVCLERFTLIWFPHKGKTILSKRAALISIVGIFVSLLAFNGGWSTIAGVRGGKCISKLLTKENKSAAQVFSSIGMALHSFIPAAILLIFTPLAIIKLYYQQSLRHMTGDERKNKRRNELLRASIMLLGVVVAYLVLVTPFCATRHIMAIQGINIATAPMLWARNVDEIANIFELANCVVNFLLYTLLSASFREHFRSTFKFGTHSSVTEEKKMMAIIKVVGHYKNTPIKNLLEDFIPKKGKISREKF